MAALVTGQTIAQAWVAALGYLCAHGWEAFDLVVEIADPVPSGVNPMVVRRVDRLLVGRGYHRVETVANTIFPASLATSSRDRATLYRRYRELLPRLHRLKGNHKGLYFERLIGYPLQDDLERANQVETIIGDLARQLARRGKGQGPLGSVYEGQIFAPGKDRLPQGFPCMSSLSFQLDGELLRLTATYRNQYYVRRALGNFLGLARLQCFVCDAVGLRPGPLTIHAFHAQVDLGKRETAALMDACRCQVYPPVPDIRPT